MSENDAYDAFSVAGIVYENGRLLMGRRIDKGFMGGRWEFLGGKVEPGESSEESLVREFKEETGYSVSVGSFICSSVFQNTAGNVKLSAFCVSLPEGFSVSGAVLPEHTELGWFPLTEVRSLNLVDSDKKLLPSIEKWISSLECGDA